MYNKFTTVGKLLYGYSTLILGSNFPSPIFISGNLTRFQFIYSNHPFFQKIIRNPIIKPHINGSMGRPAMYPYSRNRSGYQGDPVYNGIRQHQYDDGCLQSSYRSGKEKDPERKRQICKEEHWKVEDLERDAWESSAGWIYWSYKLHSELNCEEAWKDIRHTLDGWDFARTAAHGWWRD